MLIVGHRRARNQPPTRGLHDDRFVLSLVAHEPLLAGVFDDGQREAALVLNGIGNAIVHNEPLRSGDNPQRAEELAQRFKRRVPHEAHALAAGGLSFYERIQGFRAQGRHEEALATAEQWMAADPAAQLAWEWKLQALRDLERPEEALRCAEHWIALHPDDPESWEGKSATAYYFWRFEEALGAAERLLSLDGRHQSGWALMADSLEALERYDETLEVAARFAVLWPEDPSPWRWKTRALARLGRREESLTAVEQWLALCPDDPGAWEWKACGLYFLDRQEDALSAVKRWIELDPDSGFAWQTQAHVSLALGQYESALASAERWTELEPDDQDASSLKAQCLERLQKRSRTSHMSEAQGTELARLVEAREYESAERFALSCLEEDADLIEAHVVLAGLYQHHERHDDWLASAKRWQALDPDGSKAASGVVLALAALERWNEALETAHAYLARHPDDAMLWLRVSVAAWNLGDRDSAISAAQRSTQLAPEEPEGWDILAQRLADRPTDCLPAAKTAANLQPESFEAQLRLARTLTATGAHEAALPVAVTCLRLQPGDPQALEVYGWSLLFTKQAEQLVDVIENQWPGAQDHWQAQHLKCQALLRLGALEKAVSAGERAVALNESFQPSWQCLADALMLSGRHAEAVAAAERATPIGKSSSDLSRILASSLYELGHYQGAATAARKFRDAEETPLSLVLLTQATLACGDHDEALQAADRWLQLEPRGTAWLWKGRALLGLDRTEEAVQIGKMVVEMLPDDAGGWELLSLAYARIGDTVKVLEAAEHWVNVTPDDPAPRELIAESRARLNSDSP